MQTLNDILILAQKKPPKTIALACPEDLEVIETIKEAVKKNLCSFLLFGKKALIIEMMTKLNVSQNEKVKVIDVTTPEAACLEAVKSVARGDAQILMKGLIDTSIILKAVLNREEGLRSNQILSHVMVCELPKLKRLILLSDGAMNIDPNPIDLKHIVNNSLKVANYLTISRPKVALLSAVEKVNPKMMSTIKCQEILNMYNQGEIIGCDLLGPLALDLAIDPEAARIKGVNHPVAGKADILIAPYIEVANVLYKGWVFGCSNIKSAGIVVGAKAPIVLTSRADSHETKIYSIALSVIMGDDHV